MQQYGYKSGRIKLTGRGICYCMDCWGSELASRKCRKQMRKRARRRNKKIIQEQIVP